MNRTLSIVTVSVIALIIAFTIGVKIATSKVVAPHIELPTSTLVPPMPVQNAADESPPATAAVRALPPRVPAVLEGAPTIPTAIPVVAPPAVPEAIAGNAPAPLSRKPWQPNVKEVATLPQAPIVAPAATAPEVNAPAAQGEVPAQAQAPLPTPETDKREALEQERREQTNGAVNSLLAIQQRLATGDTSGVDAALAAASGSMNAVGQGALQQARTAIANKDLASASLLINQAVLTASATPAVQ